MVCKLGAIVLPLSTPHSPIISPLNLTYTTTRNIQLKDNKNIPLNLKQMVYILYSLRDIDTKNGGA
jgi:hypothetical protein